MKKSLMSLAALFSVFASLPTNDIVKGLEYVPFAIRVVRSNDRNMDNQRNIFENGLRRNGINSLAGIKEYLDSKLKLSDNLETVGGFVNHIVLTNINGTTFEKNVNLKEAWQVIPSRDAATNNWLEWIDSVYALLDTYQNERDGLSVRAVDNFKSVLMFARQKLIMFDPHPIGNNSTIALPN